MRLINDWLLVHPLDTHGLNLARGVVIKGHGGRNLLGCQIIYTYSEGFSYKAGTDTPAVFVHATNVICVLEEGPEEPHIPQPPPGKIPNV